MTKRYFYRDPLAAAWMAKHFGMRFDEQAANSYYIGTFIEEDEWHTTYQELNSKWHVHPDSLHLLEPMIGDLVQYTQDAIENELNEPCEPVEFRTFKWWDSPSDIERIIQRNGVAFMWPECEDSNDDGATP